MSAPLRWRLAAAALLALALVEVLVLRTWPDPAWLSCLLAVVVLVPVALVPVRPFVAVLTTTAALVAVFLLLAPPRTTAGILAVLLLGFAAGARLSGPRRWIALAAVLACPLVAIVRDGTGPPSPIALVFAVLLYTVPFALGLLLRSRTAAAAAAREAAEAAEEQQRLLAALAVRDERDRIAADLQRVVTRAVTALQQRAAAGRALLPDDPDGAAAAFGEVERTGQQALAEMRRLLRVLRDADGTGPLAPQPTLAGLDELVSSAAAAGLRPEVRVGGAARALPASVELSAYRIVEAALANALTHCGPCATTVEIDYAHDAVRVRVANALVGDAGPDGSGVAGMRHRAELVGGSVEAAPRDGRFVVDALLPAGAP